MLEKLGKNHSLWVKMVVGMGCRLDVAEDIVQEMYLRMHRLIQDESKIMYNDEEVNRFFVYVTLRNMYMDYLKAKNRFTVFEFREDDDPDKMNSDQYINEDVDNDQEQGFQMIMNSVADEMSTWPRYDAILANIYFKTDYSLRDISTGSGISLTSIFNSVKGYRAKLQERLMEDYEDYINGDWNLIGKYKNNGK
jgi:RNA polymerase sigma factor (sigma-70 family)